MKKVMLIAVISGLITTNAVAISEGHRKTLEKTGCTQVQEANGTCPTDAPLPSQKTAVTPFVKHVGDIEIKRDRLGLVSIDGKPASVTEKEAGNVTYETGNVAVIIYQSGKVALLKDRVFVAYAR